jgi:hypothetical protein
MTVEFRCGSFFIHDAPPGYEISVSKGAELDDPTAAFYKPCLD